jgi:UDP-N-acetylglucosamine--N-acetylmuramyl-(pentapeptide) pyrophosphoryl-undecaprenol N-acetylglucosamine transferase
VHWLGGQIHTDHLRSMEKPAGSTARFAFESIAFSGVRGKGAVTLVYRCVPVRFWQHSGDPSGQTDVVVGPGATSASRRA